MRVRITHSAGDQPSGGDQDLDLHAIAGLRYLGADTQG